MHIVSNAYKEAMNKQFRNRAYIQVGIGVISQEAQGSAEIVDTELAKWSISNELFDNAVERKTYATLEQNFTKADGKFLFMPETDNYFNTGVATAKILQPIKIRFSDVYAIKGLTLNFGVAYPTKFTVTTSNGDVFEYENNAQTFITTDVLGDTSYLIITPIEMLGGNQRLRLLSVLMGVGLTFGNNDVKNSTFDEYISPISEEVSSTKFSVAVTDFEGKFNVDNNDSFINFLQTGQKVTVSEGIELENGQIEFVELGNLALAEWNSKKGEMTLKATDKFAQMSDTYELGNTLEARTAKQEAIKIFTDMGLQPDEYQIDDYLADITLRNPITPCRHNEALQILANACRCVVFQDSSGKIVIRGNFAVVLDPEDLRIETNGVTEWSKPTNVILGETDTLYAEFNENLIKADGVFRFIPENQDYLATGYVSSAIADENGDFEINPTMSIVLPSGYMYYGVFLNFDGNPPKELIIRTFYNGVPVDTVNFKGLEKENQLFYDFNVFDTMTFEFTKGYPNNRVLVNGVSYGDFTGYTLSKTDMLEEPYGYKEETTKAVRVKIFSYELDESGKPSEIKDDVWYTNTINTVGNIVSVQNPLIDTEDKARLLAEWLGNYYANNVSYSVNYRGEPRLNATDIIHMENDYLNNLQVMIISHSLKFNGAWKGSIEMRKAIKI